MRRIGRFFRRLLLYLGLFILLLVVIFWKLVSYGISQASGQFQIVRNARPIAEVMADPFTPDSLIQKLKVIEEVKTFAIDSLGLKNTQNYTTFYDQHNEPVMWVVTASEPFALTPKEWTFPVIGTVPYKGYFNKESAVSEYDALEREGYDVRMQNPDAWSTLGWFTDPVMSGMLDGDEGDLASLIIHEMTHATLFVKDSVIFNENLASFIGDRGAESFLKNKYGSNGAPYIHFMRETHDYELFVEHMLKGADELDSLYHAFGDEEDESMKFYLKKKEIDMIVDAMDTIGFYEPSRYAGLFQNKLPNNAYFLSFQRYQSKQDSLHWQWQEEYGGNFALFLEAYKNKYAVTGRREVEKHD